MIEELLECRTENNTMSAQTHAVDPFDHLKIVLNSDGTLTRLLREESPTSTSPDPNLPIHVLTKDVPISQPNNTSARIFLPQEAPDLSSPNKELPLIVFFHGGGFILFSAATSFIHDFCVNLAKDLASIVVSVEYRLAPEHRLPAAYDDAVEALHWIRTASDDWLKIHADFSTCYLMGGSAGANIAYHAALRVAAELDRDRDYLEPLKIQGLIMNQPFFGGTKRVPSELRLANDPVLPPHVNDLMWELSLPVGVDRDHEYCNPTAGDGPLILDKVRQLGWRVFVNGCDGDSMVDHQVAFARLLEGKGITVVSDFFKGGCHGIHSRDPIEKKKLLHLLQNFIAS